MTQHKRYLRNYIIDPSFQLKHTGMVVGITLAVATTLGYFAFRASQEQTEMVTASLMLVEPPDAAHLIEAQTLAAHQQFKMSIVAGVLILVLAVGLTGIIVTHRIVGPAYRMKKLFDELSSGRLHVSVRIRKNDELHDVFLAFERMVERMREKQAEEIKKLDSAIALAPNLDPKASEAFAALRADMQRDLDG